MKKIYSFLLAFGVIAMLTPTTISAQTYTYTLDMSAKDVGNPGGKNTSGDFNTSGTLFHRGYSGPAGAYSSSYRATNYWSLAQAIPFTFKFAGVTVDSFCTSKNGLLTFSTNVAGSAVNTALNNNTALPNTNLPDSTIAYFWAGLPTGNFNTNHRMYKRVYGSTGSRQLWIIMYYWKLESMSYNFYGMCLEEGSNKIYVADMNYLSGNATTTMGIQLNSTTAVQYTSGIHSSAGSPNLVFGPYQSSSPSTNEYYEMTPKLLVTDDIAVTSLSNPSGAVCSASDSVKVLVTNEGTNSVTDFDIIWSVNGSSQTTYSYSGTLTSGSTATLNLGKYTYGTSASTFNFVFRSDDPNGNTDNNLANDTLRQTLKKGLTGDYSVGTSSSDFATVAAAMAEAKAAGVCGPVVFNIASGTYTGQISLEGDIPGASASNTVTFRAATGNPANVTLAYTSTSSSSRSTLLLKKTSYILFETLLSKH